MKRMIAFFIVFIFFIGLKIAGENNLPYWNYDSVIIVSSNAIFEKQYIQNGEDFYFTFDKNEGETVLKDLNIKEIKGLVFYFNNIDINNLLNKIDFYFDGTDVEGMKVYYGCDSSYPDYRYINGKKINVQIVENSTKTIVGYPMILCGY